MRELNIDLSGRTPTALTRELVERADPVITMGCGDQCPVIPGKKYLDSDLQDPAGQPLATVREIRDQINNRVCDLVQQLDDTAAPP
jgi:arsenate reductase